VPFLPLLVLPRAIAPPAHFTAKAEFRTLQSELANPQSPISNYESLISSSTFVSASRQLMMRGASRSGRLICLRATWVIR